jgi:hypothetical protein
MQAQGFHAHQLPRGKRKAFMPTNLLVVSARLSCPPTSLW